MVERLSPLLPTVSFQATASFYREKLEFTVSYYGNYLVLTKKHLELFFYEDDEIFFPSSCFIFVNNIEDMYAKYSSMGMVELAHRFTAKPGRLKEFAIVDNNGHVFRFAEKP